MNLPGWEAPAGLRAMERAFTAAQVDLERPWQFHGPAYWALGSPTNLVDKREAQFMSRHLTDLRVEMYEGRDHFDPPQRAEPERFARALRELWARAERLA